MINCKAIFLAILLSILPVLLFSQTIIKGVVFDKDKKPLPNINLLVYPNGNNTLIAYKVSGREGKFTVKFTNDSDSLIIVASSMNYRNDSLFLLNKSQEIEFVLNYEIKDLDEFIVEADPVIKRGDTISYLVGAFANEADRSIEDVLKKMPGIEVESSGRILYQGEPIQDFYVEDLDLMGGRYGLVTANLPHNSVSLVEILENHQPIKILEERTPSHRASMNIKLKKNITTTGTAKLGSGYEPILWDANITPMVFTKNYQMAGSYQSNNTGKDVSKQMKMFSRGASLIFSDSFDDKSDILNMQTISPPGFTESRYLDNNVHLINSNSLVRLKNDMNFRANLQYVYDDQIQKGFNNRTIYTLTDTLKFTDIINNDFDYRYFKADFDLTRNTDKNYLKNNTEIKTHRDKLSGNVKRENSTLEQSLDNPFYSIANELNIIKPVREKLISFSSFIQFEQNPQELKVSPGQFVELVNQGNEYDNIQQNLNMQRINTVHNASFSIKNNNWDITPRIGFQYKQNQLKTETFISDNETLASLGSDYINNIEGLSTKTYLETDIVYKSRSFTLKSTLPIDYIYINIEDNDSQKRRNINTLNFNPKVTVGYDVTAFWRLRGTYKYNTVFGDMQDIYYSYIFKNLNTIQLNDAPLSESKTHSISGIVGYRNPLKSLFSNFSYLYLIRNNNLLYSNTILEDGTTILSALEQQNTSYMHVINAYGSKFFRGIKSKIALNISYSRDQRKQLVNDNVFDATNNVYNLSPMLNIKFTDWFHTVYKSAFMYYETYLNSFKTNEISVFKHFLDFRLFPTNNQFIELSGEYYLYENKENYFVDLQYRYTVSKYNVDIELRWLNIFNNSSYQDFTLGRFMLEENHYILRPSQLVLSVKFSF